MKIFSKILLIFISGAISFYSCKKKETYPPVPYIENAQIFHDYAVSGKDSTLILRFSFTDGDGDIGVAQYDSTTNLFITYYEKQEGKYTVPALLPSPMRYRIPVLAQNGENTAIKGEIAVNGIFFNVGSAYDTIAFDVQIMDNAKNLSNITRTQDFVLIK